jgi:hypothetical protein
MGYVILILALLPVTSVFLVYYIDNAIIPKLGHNNSFKNWWRKHIVQDIKNDNLK